MGAPVPASAGTYLTGATGTTAPVAVPPGVAPLDTIWVFLYKENTAAVTPPAGFSEIPTAPSTTAVQQHHAFWKRATAADTGTYSFSWTGSVWREGIAIRVTGAVQTGTPYDTGAGAPAAAARSTSGTVTPGVSLTTQGPDRLLLASGTNFASGTWSGLPGGFTFQTSGTSALTVATAAQAAAGATGTVTETCSASAAETAWLIAILPADPPRVTRRQRPRAFGWQRRGRFYPVPLAAADPNLPQVADGGVGTDSFTVVDQVTITDSGTAVDTFVTGEVEFPAAGDTGTGTDTVSVLDVPNSTLLPRRAAPRYEIVVVARLPVIGGPPQFIEIDPIGQWLSLDWTTELSRPQSLAVSCNVSTLTESIKQRFRRPHALATEFWVRRNGTIVFAGPLAGGNRDGDVVTLHADGLLAYLNRMVVYSDLVFSNVDQNLIVKALVDHWQAARPYGHFGIGTSAISASGVLRDGTYLRKELHRVLQRVQEIGARANGFDIDVDPVSRVLRLWNPQRGVDRSSGEDAIVFDARNIKNISTMFSVSADDVATEAFGTGTSSDAGGTLYSAATNADLRAQYGASAVTGTWDSVSEQPTLDAHVQALLDARGETLFVPGPNVRVTPDADLSQYGAGDTVRYQVDDQLGVDGAFRLRSIKVSVRDGQEVVTPGFA